MPFNKKKPGQQLEIIRKALFRQRKPPIHPLSQPVPFKQFFKDRYGSEDIDEEMSTSADVDFQTAAQQESAQKTQAMKDLFDGLSIMSNGMEPGGGRKDPNPFENTETQREAERAQAAAQAEVEAAFAKRLADREQRGSSVGGSTTLTQQQRDLANKTYYQPKLGSKEVNWPPVTNNATENAPYVSLAVQLALTDITTIPPLSLKLDDLKDMAKLQDFIGSCSRFGLHPYIRWGFISEEARRQITLCCGFKKDDVRRDWFNWSNESFVGLFKVFCSELLAPTKGVHNTSTLAQLQVAFELTLFQFQTKLSKVDLQPVVGGISSKKKVYDFLTEMRTDELLPQYYELMQSVPNICDMTTRLVKKCMDRKSPIASNPRVGLFRDNLETYIVDDILTLDDFWTIVQDFLGNLANTLDSHSCWLTTTGRSDSTSATVTTATGNTNRGGGKGKHGVKLAAVKSQTDKPC